MPRGIPKSKPEPDDDGEFKHIRTPAAPAASSVFALGKAAKAQARAPRIDQALVKVQSGVPLPPASTGAGAVSPYVALLDRMRPGDMVELPSSKALGMVSMAKKLNIRVAKRRLSDTMSGVWRLGQSETD